MKLTAKKLSALLVAGIVAASLAAPVMAEAHRSGHHGCQAYSECPGYAACTHDADCPVQDGNCPR